MKNFREYYQYYLTLHQNRINRRLHMLGNLLTLLYVFWVLTSQSLFLLILAPFIIYPFAWAGHLYFEKNKPAAWSRPLLAKVCDWVMMKDVLTGKLKF